MRFRWSRSPRVAITLICGCALISLFVFQYSTWRKHAREGSLVSEQFVGRYEPLGEFLPVDSEVGFVIDESHAREELIHPHARLAIAQYALSPRRVASNAVSHWVIVDSDCPEAVPDVAVSRRWKQVADLRNGVRLYRTDARE